MATIESIVNVSISRDSKAVQQAAFDVMLFLGRNKFWGERYRAFSSLSEMTAAGVPSNSAEYYAARDYFSPDGAPTVIAIGRKDPSKVVLSFDVANDTTYTVYVGDGETATQEASFTSDADATGAEIAAGLELAIDTLAVASISTTVVGETVEITEVASTTAIVNQWSSNIDVTYTDTETFSEAFTAVSNENDTWYAVSTYSHSQSDIEAVAAYAQTVKKLYGYSTGNTVDITSATTNVAGQLQLSGYTRTEGVRIVDAGTDTDPASTDVVYPECTWFGRMLTKAPGSATWKFKELTGIQPDPLTTTEANYAIAKNLNTYETIGGQAITREGVVASGEYIDVIRGIDWLESRMEERIYARLVNLDKIPFTQAGINSVAAEVEAQLIEAQDAGFLAADFVDDKGNVVKGYTITIPKIASISQADKVARSLTGISFIGKLASAVHTVAIEGTVTV